MKRYSNALNSKIVERLMRWGVVGLVVWLAAMVIGAGAQSLHGSGKAAAAIREHERIRTEAAQSRQESREQIQKLSARNLFVPAPEQAQLPRTQAILGASVLIGDRWYQEGQTVQGYEIVKVGPDYVTVLRDGREQRIVPFEVEVNYGQTGRGAGGTAGVPGERGGREGREGDRGMRGRGGMGGGDATGGPVPRFGGFDAGMAERMMEMRNRIESMTPEQRQETFERFRNASPEERERMREEFMRGGNN